jgi:alkylhydroperoxidase/carboxymuconolactone decarboxylase family protein YurZ
MKKILTGLTLMVTFGLYAQQTSVQEKSTSAPTAGTAPATVTLSSKEQSLVAIAASTAKGNLSKLKTELNTGLEAGLTVNQIKEIIVHIYAYAGFPRSIRGLQTFMTVLDERKAKGINDVSGAEASPINNDSRIVFLFWT